MKKLKLLLFAAVFMFGMNTVQAQAQNSGFVYLDLVGQAKMFSNKITITVDVGEKLKAFASNRLKDPTTGKPIVFYTMVDALNYMGERGWEFEQAYVITDGNNSAYHYLMKKRRDLVEGLPASDQ